jgi:hypothetical protein
MSANSWHDSKTQWREIERVDYAGGFADNVFTRPLGSLPPRPLNTRGFAPMPFTGGPGASRDRRRSWTVLVSGNQSDSSQKKTSPPSALACCAIVG